MLTRRRFLPLLIVVSVILTVVTALDIPAWRRFDFQHLGLLYPLDIRVYQLGSQAFFQGLPIYDMSFDTGIVGLPFTYPPFAALVFGLVAYLPTALVGLVFRLAGAFLLWWATALLLERAGHSRRQSRSWGLLWLPLLLISEPVRETFNFGQVNLLLMGLVIADLGTRNPRWPRGLLVGVAAAIKLTPAVFGLFFLVRRDWKAAGWSIAGGIGASTLTWLIAPELSRQYWTDTLFSPQRIGGLGYAANQSLRGMTARLGVDNAETIWLIAVIAVLVLVSVAMTSVQRRAIDDGRRVVLLILLNATLSLLCSPASWSHHWVWLPLGGAVLVTLGYRWLGTTSLGIALLGAHWWLPHGEELEAGWPVWVTPGANAYSLTAMLWLGAVFLPASATRVLALIIAAAAAVAAVSGALA